MNPVVPLILGIVTGFILHRSRFNFYSAFSSYLSNKGSHGLRILFLTLTATTFGYLIVLAFKSFDPSNLIFPIGLFTLVGCLIFGVGMSFVKGDIISSLWCACSGDMKYVMVLLGSFIGIICYSFLYPFTKGALVDFYAESILMSDFFIPGVVIGLIFLVVTGYLFSRSD